jgi:hypothetical protein
MFTAFVHYNDAIEMTLSIRVRLRMNRRMHDLHTKGLGFKLSFGHPLQLLVKKYIRKNMLIIKLETTLCRKSCIELYGDSNA